MNIALIAPPWYPVPPSGYGGIELVVALLAREFERRGHRVTVLANGDSRPAGALRSPLRSTPSKGMIGNAFIEAGHVLGAYAEIDGADIIHDHSGALGPALASRDSSLPPVVHTLHGPWTPEASEFYRFVHERIHLVAISAAQRDANSNVRYADTIHNGIDIDMYPMNEAPRSDDLVYIGRANPGKNPDGAIRVARASARPLKLVIKRHEPDEHEYWNHAVAPLLGSDIEVLEDIDHNTKVDLLGNAHAMIFPDPVARTVRSRDGRGDGLWNPRRRSTGWSCDRAHRARTLRLPLRHRTGNGPGDRTRRRARSERVSPTSHHPLLLRENGRRLRNPLLTAPRDPR